MAKRKHNTAAKESAAHRAALDASNMRHREVSMAGREIGSPPAVADPARRVEGEASLRRFCEIYFADLFCLGWSPDHLRAIAKMERAVTFGDLFAFAMPRASGKTTLCEACCLWAAATGRRRFIVLIGADLGLAEGSLDSIKGMIETSEVFTADYPEIAWPISRLEGIWQRAKGQVCDGLATAIKWETGEVVLPTVKDSKASGAIIRVAGITGQVRGMKAVRADGKSVRPDLAIVDDPQTDESARSPSQCEKRESILAGAVLGLSGPKQRIAAMMPCTVIRPGDMADRILTPALHPSWQGERSRLVIEWPARADLWEAYGELRRESLRAGRAGREDDPAQAMYLAQREEMDRGGVISWPERFYPGELSAIQHAWNLRIDRGDAAFFAEYQNAPLPLVEERVEELKADAVTRKVVSLKRGVVPAASSHLTAFVDVQKNALFWLVAAWGEDMTGHVVDYGAFPEQSSAYFTYREIKSKLAKRFPSAGMEGAIYSGLQVVCRDTLGREFARDGGGVVKVERVLIDSAWGDSKDTVFKFCRECVSVASVMPSRGFFIGASSNPFSEWTKRPGDRVGDHWRVPCRTAGSVIRHCLIDTNHWKGLVSRGLAASAGDLGSITIFSGNDETHRMFAEHVTSEYPIRVKAKGREVDEWKIRAPGRDNHLFDCLVGSAVAASMGGASVMRPSTAPGSSGKMKLSEMQARKREMAQRARVGQN